MEAGISRHLIQSLLDALRAMDRKALASSFELEFEGRQWQLTAADQLRLLEALRPDLVPEAAQEPPTTGPISLPPAVRHHEPFLASIRDGVEILLALDALARADGWSAAREACRRLFVDLLGFEEAEVDLTPRLKARSAIERFQSLAAHGEFRVALVRLTDTLANTGWSAMSQHYTPCFRLLPHALLVAIEPGARAIRLVYQQSHTAAGSRPRYRAFVGPWQMRDPNDDLLVWTKRLDLLRPRFGDDHLELRERLEQVLDGRASWLATQWPSVPFDEGEPPGLPFGARSVNVQVSALLQSGADEGDRIVWGLEAALRNVFPTTLVYGSWRVGCRGYDLRGGASDPLDCWRAGTTREVEVALRLFVTDWVGGPVAGSDFELVGTIPVPDDDGRFWIDGDPRVFRPRIDEHGRFLRRGIETADDDEDENEDDAALEEQEEEAEDEPVEETWQEAVALEGAALDAYLQRVIERRLVLHFRAMRRAVRKLLDDQPAPSDFGPAVRAALAFRLDQRERLSLVVRAALHEVLAPVEMEESGPHCAASTVDELPASPPPWACLDLLDPAEGEFAAVTGARVHPCGTLAVPMGASEGVRLEVVDDSAFLVNPRAGGRGPTPYRWWVGQGLQRWGALPPGALSEPARAAHGTELRAESVVQTAAVAGDVAWVSPELLPRRPRWVRVAKFIPFHPRTDDVPHLLVLPGSITSGGQPWLAIPRSLVPFHERPTRPVVVSALEKLADAPGDREVLGRLDSDDVIEVFVPPGRFRVADVGLCSVVDRRGMPLGWRAWMELIREVDGPPALIDESGRVRRIVDYLDDLPWAAESGAPPQVVLGNDEDIEPDLAWFSGADGEVAAARTLPPQSFAFLDARDAVLAETSSDMRLMRSEWSGTISLTRAMLREWACVDPTAFARVTSSIPGFLGLGTALETCAKAALAADVDLPAVFPGGWSGAAADRVRLAVDGRQAVPSDSSLSRFRPHEQWRRWGAQRLTEVRCDCSALVGPHLRGRRCRGCDTDVEPRPVSLARCRVPVAELPWPVLHPWRKELAAAVLGLTQEELDEVLQAWGPVLLRAAIREVEDPLSAGRRRLTLEGPEAGALQGSARRRFGLVLERLSERLSRDPELEGLWLDAVPVPHPDLMPGGYVLGAVGPVAAPLLQRFQSLRQSLATARALLRDGADVLHRAAHVALQDGVDGLLGTPGDEGFATVAGILAECWPWRAHGTDHVGLPGVRLVQGEPMEGPDPFIGGDVCIDLRTGAPCVWPEATPSSRRERERVVVDPGGVVFGTLPPADARREGVRAILLQLSDHRRDQVLLAHGVVPTGSKVPDARAGADHIELRSLLDALPDELLPLAHQAACGASKIQRMPREAMTEAIIVGATERSRPIGLRPPKIRRQEMGNGQPAPTLEPPPGHAWFRSGASSALDVGLLVGEELVLAPRARPTVHWDRSRAVARLRARWWPFLSAILAHVASDNRGEAEASPADLAHAGLASALLEASPGLVGLLDLLELARPVPVAADPLAARDAVRQRLVGLLDGSLARAALVEGLVLAWSHWALGPPCSENPVGAWRLEIHQEPAPGLRRMLIPGIHPGWSRWSEVQLVTDPVRYIADADVHDHRCPQPLRRWVGLPVECGPDLRDLHARPGSTEPDDMAVPVLEPLPESDAAVVDGVAVTEHDEPAAEPERPVPPEGEDIRRWSSSMAEWISEHLMGGPE